MAVEHLSPEDATVWCVQADDAPLQIGGVALCEAAALRDASGTVAIDRIRRHLDSVLTRSAPRFRKVLRRVPLGQGLVWVDDEHFDIARHLRLVALPAPGSEVQLREFVARLLEAPLAPDRPLWELWVVDGVAGDRVALVPRVSHVLGDGMAVLGLMLAFFDPEPLAHDDVLPDWSASPAPRAAALLARAVVARWRRDAQTFVRVGRTLVAPAKVLTGLPQVVSAGASILRLAPSLAFTRPVGPRRDVIWLRLPLADLERVKRAEGVKLNDVVLAVVAAGVSAYAVAAGGPARPMRGVVPLSLHGTNPVGELENRFSMLFVDLPAVADPLEGLRLVGEETARRKGSLQAALGTSLLTLGGLLPQRLLRAVGPALLHHQPFANVVVTNLAGSRRPVYLLGARLLEMYPFVTVTANLGITVGAVSYDDTLGLGITVDADAVPDVLELARCVERAAHELVAASGRRRHRPANGTAPS
jgi:WS/DGAT/MGAT family acyltransferase